MNLLQNEDVMPAIIKTECWMKLSKCHTEAYKVLHCMTCSRRREGTWENESDDEEEKEWM